MSHVPIPLRTFLVSAASSGPDIGCFSLGGLLRNLLGHPQVRDVWSHSTPDSSLRNPSEL